MPSISDKMTTKAGKEYYIIRVRRGRGMPQVSTSWYPGENWSPRYTERELQKFAQEFERKVKAGEIVSRAEQKEKDLEAKRAAAKIMTLRQYGETVFMPTKTITMKETSRYTYQQNLDHWIYPALGDLKLPDITQANITALLLDMQRKGLKCNSCKTVYAIINSLFKMAYIADIIDRNPMDKVERPKPRKGEPKRKAESYKKEEVSTISNSMEDEPLQWRAIIRLCLDTGIRRGECLAIQWPDVDFRAGTVTISGGLCYTPNKGIYRDTPKNGETRTIDVDPDILALLQELRTEQARNNIISPYVFTRKGSAQPMDPQRVNKYMNKLERKYGFEHFHPHKLRHSYASVAITSGADIASVSENMGHSSKALTLDTYTEADRESRKRASQIRRDAVKKAGQG